MTIFEHEPHPRIAERKLTGPAKTAEGGCVNEPDP
jgi:hypothetical protein